MESEVVGDNKDYDKINLVLHTYAGCDFFAKGSSHGFLPVSYQLPLVSASWLRCACGSE